MSFDIKLENAFYIDKFYIIDKDKRSMNNNYTWFSDEYYFPIEIYSLKYNTKEKIVYTSDKYWKYNKVIKIRWKDVFICYRYPYYDEYQG